MYYCREKRPGETGQPDRWYCSEADEEEHAQCPEDRDANHSPAFKAKVALEAIKGEEPLIATAERFDVHPNQITKWKRQLLEGASADSGEQEKDTEGGPSIAELHAKIGEFTMDCDFCPGRSVA